MKVIALAKMLWGLVKVMEMSKVYHCCSDCHPVNMLTTQMMIERKKEKQAELAMRWHIGTNPWQNLT